MVAELIDKYIFLIQVLSDAGEEGLTLVQIGRKWSERYGGTYSRRTFNNHREAIAEVFGIEISCSRSDNRYYISYGRDATDRDATRDWLIDSFTVGNLLTLGKERLSGRVSVAEIPSGHIFLTTLISAMLADKLVEIDYRKYTSDESETLHVEPYALKESQSRWYLVGWCRERKGLRVYGLDRIKALRTREEVFRMKEKFDVDSLFAESFGVYLSDPDKVQNIFFKADRTQARYLEDLPLHPSQSVVERDGESVTFAIRAQVNEAMEMEFCRLAGKVEVISPRSLRERLADIFHNAYKSLT